jgi:hypothetical protein
MWDIKQEPAIIEKFEQIWDTKELLVSFGKSMASVPIFLTSSDVATQTVPTSPSLFPTASPTMKSSKPGPTSTNPRW